LKKALDVDCDLVEGSGGVFEISVDGKKVFSKKALGRFPQDGEILGLIRAH
jgi:selenoprotein W-related protein